MRIGIVSAVVPLRDDEAVARGVALEERLRAAGHEAELVLLPFDEATEAQLVQRAAYRAMLFAPHYDLVVTLRTPAEVIRHGRKVAWLADDPLAPGGEGTLLGRALVADLARASLVGLREARCVLAASEGVAEGLREAGLQGVRVVAPGDWDLVVGAVLA